MGVHRVLMQLRRLKSALSLCSGRDKAWERGKNACADVDVSGDVVQTDASSASAITKQKAAFHNMLIMQTRGAQVFSNPFCTLPSCGNNFLSFSVYTCLVRNVHRRFGQRAPRAFSSPAWVAKFFYLSRRTHSDISGD
jgi:hypothetical protein